MTLQRGADPLATWKRPTRDTSVNPHRGDAPVSKRARRTRITQGLAACGFALVTGGAAPQAIAAYSEFRSPTGNIRCAYQSDGGPRLACFVLSSGKQAWLDVNAAEISRMSGADYANARGLGGPTIRYGRSWSRGPFICASKFSGMDCWHRYTGTAFFVSARKSYVYRA
jgi:hypothetical protein